LTPFIYDPPLNPVLLAHVSINGGPPLPFALDTGNSAAPIILDDRIARQMHLPLTQSAYQVNTMFGKTTFAWSHIHQVQITSTDPHKPLTYWGHLSVAVKNLSYFGFNNVKPQIDGVLGTIFFLAPQTFQFNFATSIIHVLPNGWRPPGATPMTLQSAGDGIAHVTADVGGGKCLLLALDTGSYNTAFHNIAAVAPVSAHSIKVATDYVVDHTGQFHLPPTTEKDTNSADKPAYDYGDVVELPSVRLGNLTVPDVVVANNFSPTPSRLGLDFLSRFVFTLDLSRRRCFFQPLPARLAPRHLGASGAHLQIKNNNCFVEWVQDGSPAAVAGLLAGDQVVQVDNQSLVGVSIPFAQALLDGYAGQKAVVTLLRNGETVTATFVRQDYFAEAHDATLGTEFAWTQNRLVVTSVTPGGPTASLLRRGDEVTILNGQTVASLSPGQILAELNKAQDTLTIQRQGVTNPLQFQFTEGKPAVQLPVPQAPSL
jgi:hypothetical protein